MVNAIEFESEVLRGHFLPEVRTRITETMRRMEGKRIRVKLSEVKRKCSTPQKRYYWGVVIPAIHQMFLDTGNVVDGEEVHDYLKEHVGKLTKSLIAPNGDSKKVVRSITDTETPEFSAYLETIWQWAATMGVQIPLPGENIFNLNPAEETHVQESGSNRETGDVLPEESEGV